MSGSGTASSSQRVAALGVAAGGVVLGHRLTYALAAPRGHGAANALTQADHGYLSLANDLVLALALAGFAAIFLTRLTDAARHGPGWQRTAVRLTAFQVTAFGAMEVLERFTAGAPMHDLVDLIPIGMAVQAILAVMGSLVIASLLRAAASIGTVLGTGPALLRPAAAVLRMVSPRPAAGIAVAVDGIRGPPSAD